MSRPRGDVIVTGEPTVLIDGMPAAKMGDVTARGDVITSGELTMLIGGRPAARLGDATAQGGIIITRGGTVLIGSEAAAQEPTVQRTRYPRAHRPKGTQAYRQRRLGL